MYLTGIADEAAPRLEGQIRATRELGWAFFEARGVNGANIHDLPESEIDGIGEALEAAGVRINAFASTIGNWAKSITDPFEITLDEVHRAIIRMKRLDVPMIRIMSYAVLPDREPDNQMEAERFRRLRIVCDLFTDQGLFPVHENCMNYGGMGWRYTLRLLENVPGLRLVYDTGNPLFTEDRCAPAKPWPRQSPREFYENVRDHIAYVHIKDGRFDPATKETTYTFAGEGDADIPYVLEDLLRRGYDGGFSIEPHMQQVFHDPTAGTTDPETLYKGYVEYGRRFERLLERCRQAART